ncbi:MAG: TetR family transcriptional regulator [Roseivirga sp.]|nr:TetR family transcriptional regulator [Roseivirga sp.]
MSKETEQHILEKGTDLVYKNGYHGVGLQKILDEAGVPKGSFYYYFKSKEEFGLKLIDFYSKNALGFTRSFLENKERSPKDRIFDLFEAVKVTYTSQDYLLGCLLGNCSLELGDMPAFASKISGNFKTWQKLFETTIKEGQESGNIKMTYSPEDYAAFLLNSWEGALVRMKSERNNEPMDLFISFMKNLF